MITKSILAACLLHGLQQRCIGFAPTSTNTIRTATRRPRTVRAGGDNMMDPLTPPEESEESPELLLDLVGQNSADVVTPASSSLPVMAAAGDVGSTGDILLESISRTSPEEVFESIEKDVVVAASNENVLLDDLSTFPSPPEEIFESFQDQVDQQVESLFAETEAAAATSQMFGEGGDLGSGGEEAPGTVIPSDGGDEDIRNRDEDVKAILEASGQAAAAAEASMPPELAEQLELGNSTLTSTPLVEVTSVTTAPAKEDAVPDILSAASVVGEPVTKQKIEAPAVGKILKFAIPAIGVWLCGPLLSLIDTSAVGLFSGTVQQAALNPAVAVTDYAALLIVSDEGSQHVFASVFISSPKRSFSFVSFRPLCTLVLPTWLRRLRRTIEELPTNLSPPRF